MTAATYAEGTVRFPEAGGSSSFARHAFNELVSFGAAWAQMLNYVITIAISVIFVPHYLAIFWEPLRTNPWDIVVGIVAHVAPRRHQHRRHPGGGAAEHRARGRRLRDAAPARRARRGPDLPPADAASTTSTGASRRRGAQFLLAIPVGMIAYTGIETVSNLAEEARDPVRSIPRAISWVAIAVFAIYFTLPFIALSAMPVTREGGEYVTQLGQDPPEGFKNDPVLGLVENLDLHGVALDAAKLYVGVLAATILFVATNAGVIGASRITYSMATLPAAPGGLPPAAPEAEDAVALADRVRRRRGDASSCSRGRSTSSAGCTRSARCSRSRSRTPPSSSSGAATATRELQFRARPSLRVRGVEWPLFAIVGGLGTGIAWIVVVSRTRRRGTPVSPGSRSGSSSTRSTGAGSGSRSARRPARRSCSARPSRSSTGRSSSRSSSGAESREAVDLAARLAAERGRDDRRAARRRHPDGAAARRRARRRRRTRRTGCSTRRTRSPRRYGVRNVERLVRSRHAGPRDRRGGRAATGGDRRARRAAQPPQADLRRDRRLRPEARAVPRHGRRRAPRAGGGVTGLPRGRPPARRGHDRCSASRCSS